MSATAADAATAPADAEPQPGVLSRSAAAFKAMWTYKHLIPAVLFTSVSYYTVGPLQEAWSLETALFVATFQAMGGLRGSTGTIDPVRAMQAARKRIANLVEKPQLDPPNGTCVEVSISVPREAEGLLAPLAAQEDGHRTVGAEWQVNDSVRNGTTSDRVLLYFHGGAYTLMSPRSHRMLTLALSKELNCRVLSVDYRLSPETVFPGALLDAFAAFTYLTEELQIPASNIYVGGDSAGGGLSLALLQYLRDSKLPSLGGAILFSPWSDQTASMKSWEDNATFDYLTSKDPDGPLSPPRLYLGSSYDTNLTHPYVSSSLASDLTSLPPLLIQAGDAEVLRDEITLLAQRSHLAGVDVTHQIYGSGIHVLQAFAKTDVAKTALKEVGKWVKGRDAKYGAVDWKKVDVLFEGAQKNRVNVLKVKEDKAVVPPSFVFEGVQREAPKVDVREGAHEVPKKVVAEHRLRQQTLVSTVFVPKRNPDALGLVGKVRGVLHL